MPPIPAKFTPLKPKKKLFSRKIKKHVRIHSIDALHPDEEKRSAQITGAWKGFVGGSVETRGYGTKRTHLGLAN